MKTWMQVALAITGAIAIFAIILGMVTAGQAKRESQDGTVQLDKWGSVQIWEDPARGIVCYTRTSPTGFSCVKL
jgi:hypothetical protein